MSGYTKTEIKKLRKKRARLKKKLRCRLCSMNEGGGQVFVDYKDLRTLRTLIDREGRILPRRRTGNCAKCQRAARRAILRARYIALLPYVAEE